MKEQEIRMTDKEILGITPIEALPQHIGNEISVGGWVDTVRDQKRMKFVLVRDNTGLVQVTIDSQEREDLGKLVSELTPESALIVRGKVFENVNKEAPERTN